MLGWFRFRPRGGRFLRSWRRNGAHFLARFEEELLLLFLRQLGVSDGAGKAGDEKKGAEHKLPTQDVSRTNQSARRTLGPLRLARGRSVLGAGRGPLAFPSKDGVQLPA